MPRLGLYPLFLAYLHDSLNKRKLAALSKIADRIIVGLYFCSQLGREKVEYTNQRHMDPFALIGCQALYRFRPIIAELTVFTAMMIAPNCLARAMLA